MIARTTFGTIASFAFAAATSLAADWPMFSGPTTSFSSPNTEGLELVDDLSNARQLWKSEAIIPVAKGHNPYSSKLGSKGKPEGGGASPIVADGGETIC